MNKNDLTNNDLTKNLTQSELQARINNIQTAYRKWQGLHTKLQQAYKDWQQSGKLMQQLQHFYLDGEFLAIQQALDDGIKLDLTTAGEYSIMSEDTLWNAIYEHDQLLWQQLRFCVAHLDPAQADQRPTDSDTNTDGT